MTDFTSLDILVMTTRRELMMTLDREDGYDGDVLTLIICFNPDNRESEFLTVDTDDPESFIEEVEYALNRGWEPIAVTLVADNEEYTNLSGISYFHDDPTIEELAIISSMFDGELEEVVKQD